VTKPFCLRDWSRLRIWHVVRAAQARRGRCGDIVESLRLGSGRTALIVVDATGHGSAPAPLSSAIADTINAALRRGKTPGEALRWADRRVRKFASDLPYAVAFVALVDAARSAVYASAGHDLAFALHDDGRNERLAPTAPMLGVAREFRAFEARIALDPIETLVIATDGIGESRPAGSRDFFGASRVAQVVRQALRDGCDPARALLDAAYAYGGGRQSDDMGAVVARVRWDPPPKSAGTIAAAGTAR
jgi:serine phosphatase RsbU (regulator of sigma subunit)